MPVTVIHCKRPLEGWLNKDQREIRKALGHFTIKNGEKTKKTASDLMRQIVTWSQQ